MRRSLARFSGLESSVHTQYSADFIITTSAFRFSVHTGRDSESSYPRFPSIVGALIIAASILLSALMFAAGTRFTAVETSNEDVAWLVDRLSGNLYKCRAAEQGKATCEAETATGSISQKAKQ
jgi:hypothetical protein